MRQRGWKRRADVYIRTSCRPLLREEEDREMGKTDKELGRLASLSKIRRR